MIEGWQGTAGVAVAGIEGNGGDEVEEAVVTGDGWRDWLGEAGQVLGVPAVSDEEQAAVLDLVRDVAHNVARPAAPLSAFLLGMAVGRGADRAEAQALLAELVRRQAGPAKHE